jgi:hypothetical protein
MVPTLVCVISLLFCSYIRAFFSGISTNPLPPIYQSSGPQLIQLSFVCTPPLQMLGSDPTKSPASVKNIKSPKRSEMQGQDRGQVYLAASFINFGDCKLSSLEIIDPTHVYELQIRLSLNPSFLCTLCPEICPRPVQVKQVG